MQDYKDKIGKKQFCEGHCQTCWEAKSSIPLQHIFHYVPFLYYHQVAQDKSYLWIVDTEIWVDVSNTQCIQIIYWQEVVAVHHWLDFFHLMKKKLEKMNNSFCYYD